MGQGPRIHPSGRSRRGGTRQGSGRGGKGAWSLPARLGSPALPVPVPLLPRAVPVSPPQHQHYHTHPLPARSPPSHSCAVLLPLCFLPSPLLAFAAPPPLQPASAPSLPLPAPSLPAVTAKPAGRQRGAAASAARGRWHRVGTAAPPKSCRGGGWSLPCARMPSDAGSCGCLHPPAPSSGSILPPARLCLRRQLPEEPTHFWLRQGRECPVPLALQLTHPSLMFNVST